ncbi:Uncharacterised protein [Salmonella enterica subsp. enterica]|uniref:Uncharacterized protein n=1 Tax=Salmonella enterica I TaxID=59201 RepID=A0A447N536_SALET|nr:Uncharacterised protein [Salmonella enterica subsp. enterica]
MGKESHQAVIHANVFPCIAAILTGLANTVRPFINKVSVTRCCSSSATATTTRGLKRPPGAPDADPPLLAKFIESPI